MNKEYFGRAKQRSIFLHRAKFFTEIAFFAACLAVIALL